MTHDRLFRLASNDLRQCGGRHRLKGVFSEYALRHRHAVHIMHTVPSHPLHLGEGGQEGHRRHFRGVHHSGQLAADIAPQGRIRLFVNVWDAGLTSVPRRTVHHTVSLCGRQVAALRYHHQNLCVRLLEIIIRICYDTGRRASGGKLHAGIQCSRKVVRNYQQPDHTFPLRTFIFETYFYCVPVFWLNQQKFNIYLTLFSIIV